MHGSRHLLAALLLGLAACQSPSGSSQSTTASVASSSYIDANGMLPVQHSSMPHEISEAGDYRHVGSGMVLPTESHGFRRVDLAGFNADDTDVSANYRLTGKRAILTVYIFPVWAWADRAYHVSEVPEVCKDIFEGMKQAVEYRSKSPKLLREEDQPSSRFADAALSRSAFYDAAGDKVSGMDEPVRSELHASCGVAKIWIVQYRISYLQGDNMDAVSRDFMAAVPLVP